MYHISWIIPNHIMLIEASGTVTQGEILSAISLKHVMLTDRTMADRVHCVMDYRHAERFPMKPAIRVKLSNSEHEHGGWTIHLQDSPISRRLTDLTARVVIGRNVKTVTSIEAALDFLRAQDTKLHPYIPSPA